MHCNLRMVSFARPAPRRVPKVGLPALTLPFLSSGFARRCMAALVLSNPLSLLVAPSGFDLAA